MINEKCNSLFIAAEGTTRFVKSTQLTRCVKLVNKISILSDIRRKTWFEQPSYQTLASHLWTKSTVISMGVRERKFRFMTNENYFLRGRCHGIMLNYSHSGFFAEHQFWFVRLWVCGSLGKCERKKTAETHFLSDVSRAVWAVKKCGKKCAASNGT